MPKIAYVPRAFNQESLRIIAAANDICETYEAQGYRLTLRQVYYQFVARDLIPNTQQSYKRLGSIINDGRLAGLIDWNHITDRTRNLQRVSEWDSPSDIVTAVAAQYNIKMWEEQDHYVEVWVEKDALSDVVGQAAEPWNVPYFSCRGYTSQSELWGAAMRLIRQERAGQKTFVIHLGDHDPSGIDMTRDIEDRLALFGAATQVERIALNMDQVRQYDPPPNPAKVTDSRYEGYQVIYGEESWELDALDPATLNALIIDAIRAHLDLELWQQAVERRERERRALSAASRNWSAVVAHMDDQGWIGEDEDS